ncbi:MAG TPA: hypothetical protein VIE67_06440 [Rudaea sp.]|jgi:hypothetical protein|uniref:hypothetical protein n=1 Tax=Rudaea sp. TaxID=2136325 RepID=UPI002F9586EA
MVQLPASGVRVALLNQGAELKPGLRRALIMLGADIVYEASASLLDRAQLTTSGARVVVVNLGADDEPVRKIQDLLDVGDYEIVINDIETAAQLGDAEQLRWARLLVGKILQRPDFDLPPRPQGSEVVPGSAPLLSSTDWPQLSDDVAASAPMPAAKAAAAPVSTAAEDAPAAAAPVTAPDWSLAPLHEGEPETATGKPAPSNEFGIETIPAQEYLAAKDRTGAAGYTGDIDLDFDLVPLEAEAESDPIARELADVLRERARTHVKPAADPPSAAQPPRKPRKK